MSRNTQSDLKLRAYVLRRTNYGEADRILNLITPRGKISAIAKSVRKEKSRLAGGIEMFSLIEVNIHNGRGELGVVTSSKMLKYYSNIVADLKKMELASLILKKISLVAEMTESEEFFTIVDETLAAIDAGAPLDVVEAWFFLNLVRASGEQINLYRDTSGEKLGEDKRYSWAASEEALLENPQGDIGADEIKIMRLMISAELSVILRVKGVSEMISPILRIARALSKM